MRRAEHRAARSCNSEIFHFEMCGEQTEHHASSTFSVELLHYAKLAEKWAVQNLHAGAAFDGSFRVDVRNVGAWSSKPLEATLNPSRVEASDFVSRNRRMADTASFFGIV